LARTLATYESLLVTVHRYDACLTLRFATDTRDATSRERSRALDEKFATADTAVRRALAAIPDPVLAWFMAGRPDGVHKRGSAAGRQREEPAFAKIEE
jgi:oligoendopeptidase F